MAIPFENSEPGLIAFIVADALPNPNVVRQHSLKYLGKTKTPDEFIITDHIPRNQAGKIVRRELPNLLKR